jgi:hypothetical protein
VVCCNCTGGRGALALHQQQLRDVGTVPVPASLLHSSCTLTHPQCRSLVKPSAAGLGLQHTCCEASCEAFTTWKPKARACTWTHCSSRQTVQSGAEMRETQVQAYCYQNSSCDGLQPKQTSPCLTNSTATVHTGCQSDAACWAATSSSAAWRISPLLSCAEPPPDWEALMGLIIGHPGYCILCIRWAAEFSAP